MNDTDNPQPAGNPFAPAESFQSAFDPRAYLDEYFGEPDDEDVFTARFLAAALKDMPQDLLALEFGGGPALYSVAALAARAAEIHFCDFVPASLDEVRRWLDADRSHYDWRPYIRLALEAEGKPATQEAILQREAAMRQRVTRLMTCDARSLHPLDGDGGRRYDLVTAHHCTDVAASNLHEWIKVLKNVSSLVAPGGWLIVSVTTGSPVYTVGGQRFACVDLTPEDIASGYQQAGYDPNTFVLDRHQIDGEREYSGILMALARKFL